MEFIELKKSHLPPPRKPVFKNINWTLKQGENWAIIGQTGVGKTSFIEMLLGELEVVKGDIEYPFLADIEAQSDPRSAAQYANFR
jgi:ABC-type molybdenum transport system ATPase subunit/photorepair protein PhrA